LVATAEREHQRYAHEAAVTFHTGKVRLEGRTQNVSRGGLCATLEDPLRVGVIVELSIVLVFDDDQQSEALRVSGQIVWCTPVDDAYQVGVAFRQLDAHRAEIVNVFLRYLDDSKSERQPRARVPIDERFG
jgi:hypothetical protein